MKRIKQEKEDKHWANHDAFREMVNKARKSKREEEEKVAALKGEKKSTMKEMMAKAKAEREEANK